MPSAADTGRQRGETSGNDRAADEPEAELAGEPERDERGLTMIELVVAVSVFAILAGGLALTIDGGLNLARNNRNRSIAANLASQEMDDGPPGDLHVAAARARRPHRVGRRRAVHRAARDRVGRQRRRRPGRATRRTRTPQVLRVTVSVFWADMRGVAPAKSSTILSPPVGSYDPNNGHIAVKVLGSDRGPARRGAR